MQLRIRDLQDFWSGLLFIGVGAAAVFLARNYSFGTADKMGPGYFPTILGGLLVVVGIIAVIRSLGRDGGALKTFHWRLLLYVLGGTLLFGVLIRNAGLLAAVAVLVLVSTAASVHFRWRTVAISIVVLLVLTTLVFVKGLGLPIPLVGPWLGG
ncbi:MAG: tripartite tricarboxylate transporter TctB family protein [Gammaproteobacteria bacterium]|nr:tripartite tricarboxylate transporter TctB family protein [Gammaproteobacteria bacterium]